MSAASVTGCDRRLSGIEPRRVRALGEQHVARNTPAIVAAMPMTRNTGVVGPPHASLTFQALMDAMKYNASTIA